MISELTISDPSRTCIDWWDKVAWLKGKERVEFKPGLNILWGPNGSGKSTVLLAIARMLHCHQGGRTVVTGESIRELFGFGDDPMKDGAMPVHDGQGARYFDPSHKVGLFGGAFDEDFFTEGVMSVFASKASAGQQVLSGLGGILNDVVEKKVPKPEWKVRRDSKDPRDTWAIRAARVEEVLRGTIPKGQLTVLLDEPDRSLAMIYQGNIWWNLATKAAKDVQIIAASHSPFALFLPGVHYIETTPGYLAQCEAAVLALASRISEAPAKAAPTKKPRKVKGG